MVAVKSVNKGMETLTTCILTAIMGTSWYDNLIGKNCCMWGNYNSREKGWDSGMWIERNPYKMRLGIPRKLQETF